MEIPYWGALLGLALALVLIMRKVSPAYALIAGAFAGGALACGDLAFTISEMTNGVKEISPAILRVLTAGVLAGSLIKTHSASKIALCIVRKAGDANASLALILATFVLTASGVFIDVAVLTAAPIAMEISRKSALSRSAMLLALIGGGKSGNVISPNPNTIAAAMNFDAPLSSVMYSNIPAAICGIAITFLLLKIVKLKASPSGVIAISGDTDAANLPPLWAALAGPVAAVALLLLRPICGVNVDPMIALPAGGLVCALATGSLRSFASQAAFGLEKMSGVAVLLIGTGTLAGIIKASTMKAQMLSFISWAGISDVLIAPISGAIMSGVSASTTAGAAIVSSTFSEAILSASVSAVWGAAMINAGATVLDHLPHGSFFHVSAGSVEMKFSQRLKLIPFESLIGGGLAGVSTLCCYFL